MCCMASISKGYNDVTLWEAFKELGFKNFAKTQTRHTFETQMVDLFIYVKNGKAASV